MLTQTDLELLLTGYEAMAAAAQANDWDRVATLEAGIATQRNAVMARLRSADANDRAAASLSAEQQQALADGIARVLALDAEIRSHTDPFLASARKFLSSQSRERAVRNAYGAFGS